jgi:hypothetical protein
LGVGRQEYDTPVCSALERAARFHERHGAEELSERRHQRYVNARKAELGPRVRVQRRKRTTGQADESNAAEARDAQAPAGV